MTIKILDEDVVYFGGAVVGAPLSAGMRISNRLLFGTATEGGGVPTINVLLSGVSPLTLLNAVSLNYVKAFGKCEQASTPTPTSPVDITANNGAIKVRHQSGLPLGYQPYEYITASGTQWLDTGIKLASTDIVEAEYKNSSTTGYGALYGVFAMGDSSAFYANGTYYGYDVANGKVDTGVSVDTAWHTLRFDYANGIITLDGNNTTYTPFVFDNAKNNYLFARYYNNSYGYGFKGSCKRFKVIRNNEVICDLIPAKSSFTNAVGMFDLVNNVFHGNIGSGDFTASNPINDLEVYVDGTVEVVTVKQAFANDSDVVDRTGLSSSNGSTVINNNRCYVLFPCKAGVTYTAQTDTADLIGGNFIEYNQPEAASTNFVKSLTVINDGLVDGVYKSHVVCDVDGWAGWQCKANKATAMANNWQITADTSSATCQSLLSVGTYKDSQNITNGAITRNVGIKVLDGTEDWTQATTSLGVYRYRFEPTDAPKLDGGRGHCISTHFFDIGGMSTQDIGGVFAATTFLYFIPNQDVDTLAKWTTYLADQYNAGTPVIIVYPLATPTTETVTGQTLTITQGTNIVTAEGSVSDLELEVSYKGYAEVTVEEIEAVNTDENVEVTIS